MDDPQSVPEPVGQRVRVRQGDHAYVGTLVASGADAVRGKWCKLSTPGGEIEITERVIVAIEIRALDDDAGGPLLGMEP